MGCCTLVYLTAIQIDWNYSMHVLAKLDLVMIQNEPHPTIHQLTVSPEHCSFGLTFTSYFLSTTPCSWSGPENNLLLDSSIVYILPCWYHFHVPRRQLPYNLETDISVVAMNGT